MVVHHEVSGYDEFCQFVKGMPNEGNIAPPKPYFFLFTGSKLDNGVSWCPDCVVADPVIEDVLKDAPADAHFITVKVGNREVWKDSNCSFRKDPRTKLMVIPTLIRWKGPQKLEGDQCAKKDLVEMLFTEYDD